MTDWAQACGQILTSTTAVDADRMACRNMILRADNSEFSWPGAFAVAVVALALAWAFPRVLREIG